MAQGVLPFKYEEEKKERGMTALAGLPVYPVFRYLSAFHDPVQEGQRIEGNAVIPLPNEHLRGLMHVNGDMIGLIQSCNPQRVATLDQRLIS